MPMLYFYAQIFGLFIFIVTISAFINPERMKKILEEAKTSRALIFIDASVALFIGLFFILSFKLDVSSLSSIAQKTAYFSLRAMFWSFFVIGVMELVLPHKFLINLYTKKIGFPVYKVLGVLLLILSLYLILFGFGFLR